MDFYNVDYRLETEFNLNNLVLYDKIKLKDIIDYYINNAESLSLILKSCMSNLRKKEVITELHNLNNKITNIIDYTALNNTELINYLNLTKYNVKLRVNLIQRLLVKNIIDDKSIDLINPEIIFSCDLYAYYNCNKDCSDCNTSIISALNIYTFIKNYIQYIFTTPSTKNYNILVNFINSNTINTDVIKTKKMIKKADRVPKPYLQQIQQNQQNKQNYIPKMISRGINTEPNVCELIHICDLKHIVNPSTNINLCDELNLCNKFDYYNNIINNDNLSYNIFFNHLNNENNKNNLIIIYIYYTKIMEYCDKKLMNNSNSKDIYKIILDIQKIKYKENLDLIIDKIKIKNIIDPSKFLII